MLSCDMSARSIVGSRKQLEYWDCTHQEKPDRLRPASEQRRPRADRRELFAAACRLEPGEGGTCCGAALDGQARREIADTIIRVIPEMGLTYLRISIALEIRGSRVLGGEGLAEREGFEPSKGLLKPLLP